MLRNRQKFKDLFKIKGSELSHKHIIYCYALAIYTLAIYMANFEIILLCHFV